jgi:hypothetical protein
MVSSFEIEKESGISITSVFNGLAAWFLAATG